MTSVTKLKKPTKTAAATPRPVVGETPPRQDGEPAPMALDLAPGELSPAMRAYFDKCREKIGFVPHVLTSYAHDNTKLEAFAEPELPAVRHFDDVVKSEPAQIIDHAPCRHLWHDDGGLWIKQFLE